MDKELSGLKFNGVKPLQRLGEHAKVMAFANPLYHLTLTGRAPKSLVATPPDPWPGDIESGRRILSGVLEFSGQRLSTDMVLWEPVGMGEEWLMGLHGFEWLRDLRAVNGDKARQRARVMIRDWIENFDKWHLTAWRSDIMGRRLIAWLTGYAFFGESADDYFQTIFFESLSKQIKHLDRVSYASDEGFSRLISFQALIYGHVCVREHIGKLDKALQAYIDELEHLIMPDGGAYDRNPSTLLSMVRSVIDVRAVLISGGYETPDELNVTLAKMVPALRFFYGRHGHLPLFQGARNENANMVELVIKRSGIKTRGQKQLPKSGYTKMKQGQMSVIVDTGDVPDIADTSRYHLSPAAFELTYGREKIITNCGSSQAKGVWHEALRSTMAHSGVSVNQTNVLNLSEAGDALGHLNVQSQYDETDDAILLDVQHDGYVAPYGLRHARRLYMIDAGMTLVGEDRLISIDQNIAEKQMAIRFHLHPSVTASLIRDGQEVLLRSGSGAGWRMKSSLTQFAIEESVYCSGDEKHRRSQQIVLYADIASGTETLVKWALRREQI